MGCHLWGRTESDTTERLHFHFSLSCIGEGNGNPLQCSCLENPRDSGAWWAAIYGVAHSRTQLKRLSSSSSVRGLKYFKHFHTLLINIKLANLCCVFFDPASLLLGRSAYKLHNDVWDRMFFVASSCNSQKGNNLEISPSC